MENNINETILLEREALAKTVRRLRKQNGYTQEEFSDRVGMTTRSISDIENGLVDVKLSTIIKLAFGLGLSPTDLLSYPIK